MVVGRYLFETLVSLVMLYGCEVWWLSSLENHGGRMGKARSV